MQIMSEKVLRSNVFGSTIRPRNNTTLLLICNHCDVNDDSKYIGYKRERPR